MKTSHEIRQAYLDFFANKDHTIVPSASLVPDDPTLLFVNSGMVPFKDSFTGKANRDYARAVSLQKCMRVSGKHNDLDEVGPSPTHHTLFEMLGNFSFGDYFKQEAIAYAYEFITETLGIDPDRIVYSVHEGDQDSPKFWQDTAKVGSERVVPLGDDTNFWSMGDTGPCGPNSEIFYDLDPQPNSDFHALLKADDPRLVEIWNLVFMEFDQASDGTRTLLTKPGVDTGMGLERTAAVLQGVQSNYDTDVFIPIIQRVQQLRGHNSKQMKANYVPYRVLADHGRAMTFLLGDGVVPGNEKQKYVLRMVMRRAIGFGKRLGFEKPFLVDVSQAVIDHMGNVYPELKENQANILKWVEQEEKLFNETLERGLDHLERHIQKLKQEKQDVISGQEAFFLHDTLGFPIEVTDDLAQEQGFTVDHKSFQIEMKQQKERSRGKKDDGQKGGTSSVDLNDLAETEFVGSNQCSWESNILRAFDEKHETIQSLGEKEKGVLVFKQTPFYGEGGGQVGDQGMIENQSRPGKAKVLVTKKDHGRFMHHIVVVEGGIEQGDRCLLQVDEDLRKDTERNHTATHILHAVLHQVIGEHAKQAGSFVSADELRFDFTHFEAVTPEQISKIELLANDAILSDLEVQVSEESLEDAKAKGAMALFSEDYQGRDKVRMVSIVDGNEAFSRELCGGTHVKHTGEIGGFKIISEESVSAGVRRVKVSTGFNLMDHFSHQEQQLHQAAALLDTNPNDLMPRLEALIHANEKLETELNQLRAKQVISQVDDYLSQKETLGEADAIVAQSDLGGDDLKQLADLLESKIQTGVILLGTASGGRVQLICKVSQPLTKHIKAGDVIKTLTPIVGGGGGGAPHFAQGGGSDPGKLDEALAEGQAMIRSALS